MHRTVLLVQMCVNSEQCQQLSDVIKMLKNTEILGIVTKRESTRHRDKNSYRKLDQKTRDMLRTSKNS